jgi:predicted homoserine dehydrogenase-like protein
VAYDTPATREQDDEIAMDETVRVGLVGLGRMGRCHTANLAGRIPGARLVRGWATPETYGPGGANEEA